MDALKKLINRRAERILIMKELEGKSESDFIKPERINFYFATLRILHQIRKSFSESKQKQLKTNTTNTLYELEKVVSAYGMLATSPRDAEGNYEEVVENTMHLITNYINNLGFYEIFQKELQYSNKENLDLHRAQRIIPGIFLGGSNIASDKDKLKELGITHIVCCLQGACKFPEDFRYLNIPIYDTPFEDISKYFSCSFNFIHEALNNSTSEKPTNVYIHCAAGISRAPTICAAFLMQELKISSFQALKLIKISRPYISPNPGFLNQLYKHQIFLESIANYAKNNNTNTNDNVEQGIPCTLNLKRNIKKSK